MLLLLENTLKIAFVESEDNHKKHKHNDDEESNAKANESEQQNKHKHKNADEPNDDKADDKHKNKNKKEHNTDAPATTLPVNHIHYAPATEAKKHHKHDDADAAVVPDAPKTPPNDEIQQGTFFTIAPKPQDTPDDVDAVKNHAKNNQKQPTPHPTPAKHFHFDRHTRVVEEFPCDSVDTRVLDPTEVCCRFFNFEFFVLIGKLFFSLLCLIDYSGNLNKHMLAVLVFGLLPKVFIYCFSF